MKLSVCTILIFILGCSNRDRNQCEQKPATVPNNNFIEHLDVISTELTDYCIMQLENDLRENAYEIYDSTEIEDFVIYSFVTYSLPTTFKIIWDKKECNQIQYVISNPLFAYGHHNDFIKKFDVFTKPKDYNVVYNLSFSSANEQLNDIFSLIGSRGVIISKEDSINLFKCVTENYFQTLYPQSYIKLYDKNMLLKFLKSSDLNKKLFTPIVLANLEELMNSNLQNEFYCYYNLKTESLDVFILPSKTNNKFQRFFLPPLKFYQEEPFM